MKLIQSLHFVIALLVLSDRILVSAINVLIMGDSVDRNMILDWCNTNKRQNKTVLADEEWGHLSILAHAAGVPEPYDKPSYWICRTSNDTSLAHSHFFGSRPTGPYYNNHRWFKYPNIALVHTETRMVNTYERYIEVFGHPDKVVLNFAMWDLSQRLFFETSNYPSRNDEFWNSTCAEYYDNLRARVAQAIGLTRHSTNIHGTHVFLRTNPYNLRATIMMTALNSITRRVAVEMGVGLFDFDSFVYDKIGIDQFRLQELSLERQAGLLKPMFVDTMHLTSSFSSMAASVLVEEVYSLSTYIPSAAAGLVPALAPIHQESARNTNLRYNNRVIDAAQPFWKQGMEIRLLASLQANISSTEHVAQHAYLFDPVRQTRHTGLTPRLLMLAKLGPGDVYRAPEAWIQSLPLGHPIPHFDKCHVIRTHSSKAFGLSETHLISEERVRSESLFLRFRDHLFSINTSVVQRRLLSMLTGAPYEPEPSTRKLHLLPSAIIAGHTDGLRGARKLHAETSTTTSSLLRKRMMTQSQPEDEAEAKKYCLHFPAWALEALPDAIFGFKQIWDKEETETVFTFIENIPEKYFFNNETRILLRAPGMRQVYMLHAGQRIPINSAAEMVELGREWGDVLSVSVKQMTMLCELFACDYDPVSGGLIL